MIGDLEAAIRTKGRARAAGKVDALIQALNVLAPKGFGGQQSGIPGQTNADLVRTLRANLVAAVAPIAEQELIDKAVSEIRP